MADRLALVWNPVSGSGRGETRARNARRILARRDLAELTLCRTGKPGDARAFARSVRHDHDVILALGGDGTLNEVVSGLLDDGPGGKLAAILPLRAGTSNIMAMELGIPTSVPRALRLLDEGARVNLDRGLLDDGRTFVLWLGAGLDGDIVSRLAAGRKGTSSKLAYLGPILSCLRSPRRRLEMITDGKQNPGPYAQVIIANASTYGWAFRLSGQATVTGGALVALGIRNDSLGGLLSLALAGILRRLDRHPRVDVVRATTVEVRGESLFQIDGDAGGATPLRVTVIPGSVPMIVPRKTAERLPGDKDGSHA